MKVVYLDNAATSWPKPESVSVRMQDLITLGANPGRGNYRLAEDVRSVLFNARVQLARLFNCNDPQSIIFTSSATHALNQAIIGFLQPHDHVITTTIEHNSVRRPLEYLKNHKAVEVTYISPRKDWSWDIVSFERQIQKNTKLIVVSHVSNLTGAITPIEEIGRLAKERGIALLVDASQSAGVLPIDVVAMNVDMLAFPGHKGLYGPQGTGGLYINQQLRLEPLIMGGTGNYSEDSEQPLKLPYRYESGTPNTPGIGGLLAGVEFVLEQTVERIYEEEMKLTAKLLEELNSIELVRIYGPSDLRYRTGVVSFNVEGIDPIELGVLLDEHYGIAVRAGYHCTPIAHQTAGTFPGGSLRVSFGTFNTDEDVRYLVSALKDIVDNFEL
ncbi:aminotransferase class V-fold PLP-dependent enzyme [Paenibacillus woosongensis]|uniref:cysteine desulfurase n=1 Tax=Paenibacillus woosongensis TaxID=307580 RepID=A0A7X3CNS9_9BACL|nr:aminotransferase class V-fold PLP-dependent enzyme [Paenibacillus woosongensis]MUG45300.1 aminotransferase class V-fold PLP-dependent enzyme [Paenibacillus woosongensis]